MVDNRRVVHGRTGFSGEGGRDGLRGRLAVPEEQPGRVSGRCRRVAIGLLPLALVACQPFTTVSEDSEHVTYQFDPTEVEQARVVEAAEDKCEMSPLGARPAMLVSIEDLGTARQLSFVCRKPDGGLNIGPTLNRELSKLPLP